MKTTGHRLSHLAGRILAVILVAALAVSAATVAPIGRSADRAAAVRMFKISYAAHNGKSRFAYVLLPAWYRPGKNPPLPLVISPHGRGVDGLRNTKFWGNLPAVGEFAVVSPDGMGRRLKLKSFGYAGQIDDLARMPKLVTEALPWVRIDRSRIYALGSSMGGMETLLLVSRHPHLLAGAVAMDSVTDLVRRVGQMPRELAASAVSEVGGLPAEMPQAYAARSALSQAQRIARSGVPLQIWWSWNDRIVIDQAHQSQALFETLRRLGPCAPLTAYSGRWAHSTEMRAEALLPVALERLGLLPTCKRLPHRVHVQVVAPAASEL
jgi:pimeloyl-ACP methyl ester carboxylesterase